MTNTIFYPDIYSADAGIDLKGAPVVCIKATQGLHYINPDYATEVDKARGLQIPHFAYHWLDKSDPVAQAKHCHSVVGNVPLMVDDENDATLNQLCEFIDAYRKEGGVVHAIYLPHWYWESEGSPSLEPLIKRDCFLVSSDYTAYSENGPGWNAYGGMTPEVWQFSDSTHFGGKVVDFNAFKGDRQELLHLLATGSREKPRHWQEWESDGTMTLHDVAVHLTKYPPATILRETAIHFGKFDDKIFANVNDLAMGNVRPIGKGGKLFIKI